MSNEKDELPPFTLAITGIMVDPAELADLRAEIERLEADNRESNQLAADNFARAKKAEAALRRIADYSTDGEGAAAFARRELNSSGGECPCVGEP